MGFALNCVNVPFFPAKKGDKNQNIRHEIVPLAKMGILWNYPVVKMQSSGKSLFLLPFYLILSFLLYLS